MGKSQARLRLERPKKHRKLLLCICMRMYIGFFRFFFHVFFHARMSSPRLRFVSFLFSFRPLSNCCCPAAPPNRRPLEKTGDGYEDVSVANSDGMAFADGAEVDK